jgi:hypothetical protein
LRRLNLAAPIQLPLALPEVASSPLQRWGSLPDAARVAALSVLVRMIAAGVVDDGADDAEG